MELHERLRRELGELQRVGRYRRLPLLGGRAGGRVMVDGQWLVNLSSNDYLGLAALVERERGDGVAVEELDLGMTSSSSRLLTGNHEPYGALEGMLATLYGREAALVLNSGYHANIGLLPALAGRHDLVLSDRLNHASIIDGMRLADAQFLRYRHGDCDHLELLLADAVGRYRQVFVVTESIFSMDGDRADLRRLVALKRQYGAFLIVDEAHAVGVLGRQGLGLCEEVGVVNDVDVIIGTFGKALASMGAYVVLDDVVREYLVNTMRSLIFTTALPPAVVAWSMRMVERSVGMELERVALQGLAGRLRGELAGVGVVTGGDSHIVPVLTGGDEQALRVAAVLRDAGFLGMAVRPPTVPVGSSRIRLSLHALLEWEDVAAIPALFAGMKREGVV